jgi:hypothetical protein
MSLRFKPADRRAFIGGSDARVIMGDDEAALLRLWREKRGEAEAEDLSGNLIVQLGVVTNPCRPRLPRDSLACVRTAGGSSTTNPLPRLNQATQTPSNPPKSVT